jgi:hypothetical protein
MESMVLNKLKGCYEDKQSLRRSETEIQFIWERIQVTL